MKTIKYILFVILFTTTLISCEDELLNQINPNAVSNQNFWKTKSDFEKGLNALYGALQFTSVGGADVTFKETMGDLAGTESWYSGPLTFANLKWTDATDFVQQRWSQLYIGVFRANQILYYIEKTDIYTQDEKNLIIAQARFMRAFCYFNLMADYNQAIIHTTLPQTQTDFSKPASSADSIRSRVIIPDLKFAYNILPKQWDKSKGIGRFTWGASASLLGKTYLYAKDWTNAAKYFKEVIDSKVYSLTEDYMANFTTENEFNSESILEISYSDNFKKGISGYKVSYNFV